ncbi:MAG: solute carrier family 23 protein [Desulfitobacteriaceae bacterium]|nr:solute carrier family 23 protein [Desulfitobacteriaceae bacterium]MDI6913046.1 solute carrier family 23 protein [Desulfitobacteriaceae bacterium]
MAFTRIYDIEQTPPLSKAIPLSFQHVFAMFGATILVPLLTGFDPSVTLFASGLGTLIFHLVTQGKVPAYLGSSFAFIAPIIAASKAYGPQGALTGMMAAGIVYALFFIIIALAGLKWIERVLPTVVVGPVVMIIGLSLTPVAIQQAQKGLLTAFVTAGIVVVASVFGRGFVKIIPILLGTVGGYLFAISQGQVNFAAINKAAWLALPQLSVVTGNMPVFTWGAVSLIAPIAIAAIVEDVGHLLVIGDTVDRDLMHKPGLHKVLLGNGIATFVAGFLGGVPETTYGENIGVLAITRVFSARVIQGAAVIAILLSFVQKFGAAIQTIPEPVLGGITIILYGMIASVGLRNLVEAKVNLSNNRNLIIVSIIFTLGVGGIVLNFGGYSFAGVGPAAVIGILLNLFLPKEKEQDVPASQ